MLPLVEIEPREVSCKRCGKTGLHWVGEDGQYVLMEGRYKVHRCDQKAVDKATADDFEGLD